jgi:hypothetical protein
MQNANCKLKNAKLEKRTLRQNEKWRIIGGVF